MNLPERKAPLLSLRPVFDKKFATMQCIGYGAAGTLILTVVGGTFLFILLNLIGIGQFIRAGYIYGLVFVASVVCLPAWFFETKKKAYAATVAHFHAGYLDYQLFQNYVTRKRGRIYYRDIADIKQQASLLQEQRHLTSITLFGDDPRFRNAVVPLLKLTDIPQTQDYLGFITDLVERDGAEEAALSREAAV